jgi:hypothetical protein
LKKEGVDKRQPNPRYGIAKEKKHEVEHENMIALKDAACGGLVPDAEGNIASGALVATPMNAKKAGVKREAHALKAKLFSPGTAVPNGSLSLE